MEHVYSTNGNYTCLSLLLLNLDSEHPPIDIPEGLKLVATLES